MKGAYLEILKDAAIAAGIFFGCLIYVFFIPVDHFMLYFLKIGAFLCMIITFVGLVVVFPIRLIKELFKIGAYDEEKKGTGPLTPKPPPAIDEQFVENCLQQKYEELPETRSWNSDPAFQRVLDPLNSGDNIAVCREAESLLARFSDFADLYDWWGEALLRMGSVDRARQVLTDGLDKTKKKYPLCNLLGKVEWKARDIEKAVYWWAQGLHCQESLRTSNYGGSDGAYLYLHYVAEGLGLAECSGAFLKRVDAIRPGMIRLNAVTANDLIGLSSTAHDASVGEVLRKLVDRYIVPTMKASAKADPAEIDRLIYQLKERDSSGWPGEKSVAAARKLGELADPRAIEPLAQAMNDLSLELQVVAEESIKKIKQANGGYAN